MHLFWIKYESYEIKIDEYREAFSTPELTMGVDHLYFKRENLADKNGMSSSSKESHLIRTMYRKTT